MLSPYVVPAPFAARYQLATAMYMPTLLGFQKSLEYLVLHVGMEWIFTRIKVLARHMQALIREIPEVEVVTPLGKEAGMVEFHVDGWDPDDLCTRLNERNVMIRPEPKHQLPASARISTGFYNTEEELDQLAEAIRKICWQKARRLSENRRCGRRCHWPQICLD
jgi:selenocysteine lyase/cysteine desulfurase